MLSHKRSAKALGSSDRNRWRLCENALQSRSTPKSTSQIAPESIFSAWVRGRGPLKSLGHRVFTQPRCFAEVLGNNLKDGIDRLNPRPNPTFIGTKREKFFASNGMMGKQENSEEAQHHALKSGAEFLRSRRFTFSNPNAVLASNSGVNPPRSELGVSSQRRAFFMLPNALKARRSNSSRRS